MANGLRHMVSKKKRRFMQDGFDLDLSYITDHIIAMGFPADKVEGLYRNPIKQVKKFYEQKHADRYKLYNLCAERTYDAKKFHGRVSHYPFEDHNAPPVDLIVRCCKDIEDWLALDAENIVGINCKAGKGRTGLIICCYLLHSKQCKTTDEALSYYGAKRTHDGKGVTIASQQRYIRYYEKILQIGGIPPIRALYLNKFRVHTLPNFPSDPYLTVEMKGHIVFKTNVVKVPSSKSGEAYFDIDCSNTPVFGDVKLQLCCAAGNKTQNLCHFWFNTGFVDESNKIILQKGEIDVANKDKKCVRFKNEFALEMFFEDVEEEHKGKVPQVVITEEDNPKSPSKKRRRIVSVVLNDNIADRPKEVLVIDKTKKASKNNNNNNAEAEPTDTKPVETRTEDGAHSGTEKGPSSGAEKVPEKSEKKPGEKKDDKDGRNRGRSFYHYKDYSDEGKHAQDEDVSSTTSEEFQEYFESYEESNSTELVVENTNARKNSSTNLSKSKNSPKPSKKNSKDDDKDSAEGKTKSPRTKSKVDVRISDSPRKKDDAEKKDGSEVKDEKKDDKGDKKDGPKGDKKDKKDKTKTDDKKDEVKADKKDKKGDEKEPKTAEPVVEKSLDVKDDKTAKRKGSKRDVKKDEKKEDAKDDAAEHEHKDVKKVKGDTTKASPKVERKNKDDLKAEKEKKKQEEKDEKEKKKQEERDEKEKKRLEEKEEKEKKKEDKKGKKDDKPAEDKKKEAKEETAEPAAVKHEEGEADKHDKKDDKPAKEKKKEGKDEGKKAKENGPESKKSPKEAPKENGPESKKSPKEKQNGEQPAEKKKDKKDKTNGHSAATETVAATD